MFANETSTRINPIRFQLQSSPKQITNYSILPQFYLFFFPKKKTHLFVFSFHEVTVFENPNKQTRISSILFLEFMFIKSVLRHEIENILQFWHLFFSSISFRFWERKFLIFSADKFVIRSHFVEHSQFTRPKHHFYDYSCNSSSLKKGKRIQSPSCKIT